MTNNTDLSDIKLAMLVTDKRLTSLEDNFRELIEVAKMAAKAGLNQDKHQATIDARLTLLEADRITIAKILNELTEPTYTGVPKGPHHDDDAN